MYFATESAVWSGGRAFYDPDAGGRVLAKAYLVSVEQFSDIAAQEMHRTPGGACLDLTEVLARGRSVLGQGRYETLVCAGRLDGLPVLTFTAPWGLRDVTSFNPPSAAYVRCLAAGLVSAGVWDVPAVAAYLAACPGAAGHWSAAALTDLLDQAGPQMS
ncbi:histone deacetylase [Streptomyces sp. NPDC059785]|uniref:histone deacetylase n=1 Tax=Streptomyces sp. NPDC059785 TaxID=3346945 RepID=UPI0036698E30